MARRLGNGVPPRYSNANCKQRMLQAALPVATQRGYESMRIAEIIDSVGVTRQAFYAHFRDKRHCLCEAIDPSLGAIERTAATLAESDPQAAAKVIHALDDLIAERFGSAEGTRGRIVAAMIGLLREQGSFHKVRIGALAKAAHVPPGDFYRQFSGKGECFAVAYQRLLGELVSEVRECPAEHSRHDVSALLQTLAVAFDSDPERRRILLVEAAHLPDSTLDDIDGARKDALRSVIAELLADCEEVGAGDPRLTFVSASVVEVIRAAEVAGEGGSLSGRVAELYAGLGAILASTAGPARLRAA